MTSLESLCRSYAASHPSRDGGTWDQWCGSLMFRMCDAYGTAPTGDVSSAWTVWKRTPTGGTNASTAPQGAFHFWDIGGANNGHVGLDVNGGGSLVFMATRRVTESLGDAIGFASVADYTARSGARYVGWCLTYADGDVTAFTPGEGGAVDYAYGLSPACQGKWQAAMQPDHLNLYDGPVDNEFGENSVKGMQQHLVNKNYLPADYEVDGIPGPRYGTALQEYAKADGGYAGDIDGAPGPKTSEALIRIADKILSQTTPPVDPPPVTPPAPSIPTAPEGHFFMPDMATPQAGADLAAFKKAGGTAVFVKMGGGNASDSPYIAPHYVEQIAAARANGLKVGHYWFNGVQNGLTPESSADFFAEHAHLVPGDLIALDVEAEPATGTAPWTPVQARAFANRLRHHFGEHLAILIYLNKSLLTGSDWSALAADGHGLWIAWPNPAPAPVGAFPQYELWQYGGGKLPGFPMDTDLNYAVNDVFEVFGFDPVAPEPDPDPEPPVVDNAALKAFLTDLATLASEHAARL